MSDEARIRLLAVDGDLSAAATAMLELYGGELLGYLHATARADDLANEAYAELCEDMWRGLPAFRWESSLRTWLYTLARNALNQLRRGGKRTVALSAAPEVAAVARTQTQQFRRTDVKDAIRELRAELDPDEHELILLRVDRDLAWNDIAEILGGDAATLRKRFERAKARLKKLAKERGLV